MDEITIFGFSFPSWIVIPVVFFVWVTVLSERVGSGHCYTSAQVAC